MPRELSTQMWITSLPQAINIVKPVSYGVYHELHMNRLYMEYSEHGDLENLIRTRSNFAKMEARDQQGNLVHQ